MEEDKLKPCPFCGTSVSMYAVNGDQWTMNYRIECKGCGLTADFGVSLDGVGVNKTIKNWNRRACEGGGLSCRKSKRKLRA